MLYPSIAEMMQNNTISRYSLVSATSKLARMISVIAEEREEKLNENPVRIAVHFLYNGIKADTIKIIEPPDRV